VLVCLSLILSFEVLTTRIYDVEDANGNWVSKKEYYWRWLAGTNYVNATRINWFRRYFNSEEYTEVPTQFNLTVTGNSGGILFDSDYPTSDYSVNCIKGCPENTLDCGDCCLPCDEIFNSISDIRKLISRIN
jgi:hypothetical protein